MKALREITASRKPGFNYGVNGFRGVCVLLVFAFHVANSGLPGRVADSQVQAIIDFWTSSLRYGVELFFMISGYVIVQSLARHATVGAFLWDRVLRIFPAWIPVHLGLCAIGMGFDLKGFASMPGGERLLAFFANLFLLPPLISVPETHYGSWSLTYEWTFYLLASAMALIAQRRGFRWLAATAWSLVVILLLCALPRAVFFIPGVLVALAEHYAPLPCGRTTSPTQSGGRCSDSLSPRAWERVGERGKTLWLRFPLVSLVLLLGCWRLIDVDKAHPWAYSLTDAFSGANALYALVALLAGLHLFTCVAHGPAGRWLRSAPLQFLGTISYSFYLWHPIVMFPVKRIAAALFSDSYGRGVTTIVFAVVSLIAAAAVSLISYRVFEVRLAKAIRAWIAARRDRASAIPTEQLPGVRHV